MNSRGESDPERVGEVLQEFGAARFWCGNFRRRGKRRRGEQKVRGAPGCVILYDVRPQLLAVLKMMYVLLCELVTVMLVGDDGVGEYDRKRQDAEYC